MYFTQELSLEVYWSRFVDYPVYLYCLLFASPLKFCSQRVLIFSRSEVLGSTSMNFAYLAGFQAIGFLDLPVLETLNILFVGWAYTNLS